MCSRDCENSCWRNEGGQDDEKQCDRKGGFWKGFRNNARRATHVISNATKLHQVDHSLSEDGLDQARALRKSMTDLTELDLDSDDVGNVLLKCKHWLVSPLLRALQTAAYALSPLYIRDNSVNMVVSPEAQEIMSSNRSYDCQGKVGNIGVCVFSRAISKIALILSETEKDPGNRELMFDRQAELGDVSRTLCAMEYSQVAAPWWKEIHEFKKEDHILETDRVRRLTSSLLKHEDTQVGLVAHSLLFQKILQMFWPTNPIRQELIRRGLRNGARDDCLDPLKDKIMNCGVLIVTFEYHDPDCDLEFIHSASIINAEFLFDGHMESQEDLSHPETFEEALEASVLLGGDDAMEPQDLEAFLAESQT